MEVVTGAEAVHMALDTLTDMFMAKALQHLTEQQGLSINTALCQALVEVVTGAHGAAW